MNKISPLVASIAQASAPNLVTGTQASINSKGELMIYGVIGDWWDELDAETVVRQAEQAGTDDELHVHIHSEGGGVTEGLAIFTALKQSEKTVIVHIDGIAASMASAVACAADKIIMPSNALMMLHKPHMVAHGNADELRDFASQIDVLEDSLIECYAQRPSTDGEAIKKLISDGKDHWLTAKQCLEMGLCDEIIEDIKIAASYDRSKFLNPPEQLWSALAITAAAAAKPPRKQTMFKLKSKSGGSKRIQAILAALNALGSIENAMAALASIQNAEDIITGKIDASDSDLVALEAALSIEAPASPNVDPNTPSATAAAAQAVAAERGRIARIQAMGKKHKIDDAEINAMVDGGVSITDANAKILDILASRSDSNQPVPGVCYVRGAGQNLSLAMASALLHRANPGVHAISDDGKEFAYMSMIELAKAHLGFNGVDVRGKPASQVAAMAFQSGSDFPAILADVANKSLRAGYEAAPRTFVQFCRKVSAKDFKPVNRVQLESAGGSLGKVGENGEFKRGKLLDGKESYKLETYGEIIAFTRQLLINDDLDALSRVPMLQGQQVAETESDIVWGLILSNVKMSDGKDLFHSAHGNLISGALGKDSLSASRKAMRKQKKPNGKTPLNLRAKHLIVPAELETAGQEILTAVTPGQSAHVNPFAGSLELLVEPRLDEHSESEWYVAADNAQIDTIEYSYLEGEEGAYLETREGFDVDGIEMKVRADFGAGAIDHRGLQKSNGQ